MKTYNRVPVGNFQEMPEGLEQNDAVCKFAVTTMLRNKFHKTRFQNIQHHYSTMLWVLPSDGVLLNFSEG